VALHTDAGTAAIDVEGCLEPMTWTWGYPVGLVPGALSDGRDGAIMCELPALLSWDGERADGWIEKSFRPSRL
jgi:hypothetical protein